MASREIIFEQIKQFYPDLKSLKDDFFIIGASAMMLSGVDIETSDIDILTSVRDADLIQTMWADKRIADYSPAQGDLFRSNFARYAFGRIDIEVMGGLEVNKDGMWQALIVKSYYTLDSHFDYKIPTIGEQERILKFFGRPKDIQKIGLLKALRYSGGNFSDE